jgi:hypothetical protein
MAFVQVARYLASSGFAKALIGTALVLLVAVVALAAPTRLGQVNHRTPASSKALAISSSSSTTKSASSSSAVLNNAIEVEPNTATTNPDSVSPFSSSSLSLHSLLYRPIEEDEYVSQRMAYAIQPISGIDWHDCVLCSSIILACGVDGMIHAIDTASGATRWSISSGRPLFSSHSRPWHPPDSEFEFSESYFDMHPVFIPSADGYIYVMTNSGINVCTNTLACAVSSFTMHA